MRLWGGESDTGCCSVSDVDDARRVAQQLDIDHLVFNFTEDFDAAVVSPYVAAHADGSTPNPCIECNRRVKFARLAERADVLGFDAVATGHHAWIERRGDGWARLRRGADRAKDQSYVVHMLDQADVRVARCSLSDASLTRPSCGRWRPGWVCARPPSPTARTSASSRPRAGAMSSCGVGWRCIRRTSSTPPVAASVRCLRSSWSRSASAGGSAWRAEGRSGSWSMSTGHRAPSSSATSATCSTTSPRSPP